MIGGQFEKDSRNEIDGGNVAQAITRRLPREKKHAQEKLKETRAHSAGAPRRFIEREFTEDPERTSSLCEMKQNKISDQKDDQPALSWGKIK
jgi:hypothetical protein